MLLENHVSSERMKLAKELGERVQTRFVLEMLEESVRHEQLVCKHRISFLHC